MIKVQINKTNNRYSSLIVSGHSNYDEHGKDIVCAGVSAVVTGGLNALAIENKNKISYRVEDGYVNVDVLDIENDRLQLIMDVIVIQLKTIEESYKKYVKISEK
jgi:uncharacterized protein YsxB (DUF464 family)